LLTKYSNFNYLRIKIFNILKKFIGNKKEKEKLLLKIHFFIWNKAAAIPYRFSNLSFNYINNFSINNSKIKNTFGFNASKLKIIKNNDSHKESNQLCFNLFAKKSNKHLLIDSFSNTESNIHCISALDKHRFFMLFIFKIYECVEKRNQMNFMNKFIILLEQIKKEDEIILRINEIENSRINHHNFEIVNNQEEKEITFTEITDKNNKFNNISNNLNIEYNNDNNLFDYIKDDENEFENPTNYLQIKTKENNNDIGPIISNNSNDSNNTEFKFKNAFEKIIFMLDSYKKCFELNLKCSFWISFIRTVNYNTNHDKIIILGYKLKQEKLSYLIRKKQKNQLKTCFKKFAKKAFLIKEQDEKEELEFFQNTNFSLILLGLIERIFMNKLSEREMQQRFFSNLKLNYLKANFFQLSNRLTDLDNSNFLSENVKKKNLIFNRVLISLHIKAFKKQNALKTCFYKWKNFNLKSTAIEQSSILNSLPNLEEEFTERINDIEIKYRKIMDKNKFEFESKINEKNYEINESKNNLRELFDKITELQRNFESEKQTLISNYEK